ARRYVAARWKGDKTLLKGEVCGWIGTIMGDPETPAETKLHALKELSKLLGLYAPDKVLKAQLLGNPYGIPGELLLQIAESRGGAEAAVAVVEQDADTTVEVGAVLVGVHDREVGPAVAVEVGDYRRPRIDAGSKREGRAEETEQAAILQPLDGRAGRAV